MTVVWSSMSIASQTRAKKKEQEYFADRALYYTARAIVQQGIRGIWDYHLAPVYTVCFIKLKFLSGKLAEVAYLCQLAEDWILLAEWHLFKHVHILHYINPTIKYIHTLCLRVLVEQRQLEVHNTHPVGHSLTCLQIGKHQVGTKLL
jgi:hypothetical protein